MSEPEKTGGVGRRQLKYHFKTLGIDLCKLYSFLHETISTSSLLTALADISTTAPSRSRAKRAMRTTRQVFNEILVSSSCSTFRYERRGIHNFFLLLICLPFLISLSMESEEDFYHFNLLFSASSEWQA